MPHGVYIRKQNKDGFKNIVAKYALWQGNGATIYVKNAGIIKESNEGGRYFVTVPRFETYDARYK